MDGREEVQDERKEAQDGREVQDGTVDCEQCEVHELWHLPHDLLSYGHQMALRLRVPNSKVGDPQRDADGAEAVDEDFQKKSSLSVGHEPLNHYFLYRVEHLCEYHKNEGLMRNDPLKPRASEVELIVLF